MNSISLGSISLVCDDALSLLKRLPDRYVQLIVTDPPYNLDKSHSKRQDGMTFDDYLEFSRAWLTEAKRVLTTTGTIYVFMGVRYISYIYSILERDLGMYFNSWITWYYTQGIGKVRGYSPRHDDILMFTKDPKDYYFDLDAIRVPQKYERKRNNMKGANPGNVWQVPHIHYCSKHRQNHPTQKPEALFERMIRASSFEGGIVLDPFVGSGTSMRVCQQLGRNGIGVDINPEYIEMTKKRLGEPFTGFDSVDERMSRTTKK